MPLALTLADSSVVGRLHRSVFPLALIHFDLDCHGGILGLFDSQPMKLNTLLLLIGLACSNAFGQVVLYKQSVTVKVTGGGTIQWLHIGGWTCVDRSTTNVAFVDATDGTFGKQVKVRVLEDFIQDSAYIVVDGKDRQCSFLSVRTSSLFGSYTAKGRGPDPILNIGLTNAPLVFPKCWKISSNYAGPGQIREFSGSMDFDGDNTRFCNNRGMSFDEALSFLKNNLIQRGYKDADAE